jgi:hypothetical protein
MRKIEGRRALEVVAERLLDHDASERPVGLARETGVAETVDDDRELRRRDAEVVEDVAGRPRAGLGLLETARERGVGGRVVEVAGDPVQQRREALPLGVRDGRSGERLAPRPHLRAVALVAAGVASADADQRETSGQETPEIEVVERRDELAAGEIALSAEDHHRARAGDAVHPQLVAQRVRRHQRAPRAARTAAAASRNATLATG